MVSLTIMLKTPTSVEPQGEGGFMWEHHDTPSVADRRDGLKVLEYTQQLTKGPYNAGDWMVGPPIHNS
jgi:hypothetical protein